MFDGERAEPNVLSAAGMPHGTIARALLSVWQSARNGRAAPRRADITLSMVRKLTQWLWVLHADGDTGEFRFRLIGDGIVRTIGHNDTGKVLSQIRDSEMANGLRAICRTAATQGTPAHFGPTMIAMSEGRSCLVELFALPLSETGEKITGIIGTMERFEAALQRLAV